MTIQVSVDMRNAWLDAIETLLGASPILKIRSGVRPANVAAADTGDVLATFALPADWMLPASGGTKSKSGTWQDLSADMDGVGGHFRIYMNDGVTCKLQGSFGTGGTDMIANSVNFTATQLVTIIAFTLGAAND